MAHCRFCLKAVKAVEKHEARCKVEHSDEVPTMRELTQVVRHLLERVEAQDRTIQCLKRAKTQVALPAVTTPTLTERDLKLFLTEGIQAMLAEYSWPVAVHDKVPHVCENGEWVPATDAQLKACACNVTSQLAKLFQAYVERKGWLLHDPKGLFPEYSIKVYGIEHSVVQQALLRRAK